MANPFSYDHALAEILRHQNEISKLQMEIRESRKMWIGKIEDNLNELEQLCCKGNAVNHIDTMDIVERIRNICEFLKRENM